MEQNNQCNLLNKREYTVEVTFPINSPLISSGLTDKYNLFYSICQKWALNPD